jgi:hypothetical protein
MSAQFPVCGRADGPAATSGSTALFQSEKLLGAEGFVMDLTSSLDEVLKVCACQEVSQVDKLAVVFVFNVDDSPPILTSSNLLATNNDCFLASDNCERNDVLDLSIESTLLVVELVVVVRVHLEIVESELLLYALLEGTSFLKCQRVRFGNDRDNVDNVGKFLQNDDVNWL